MNVPVTNNWWQDFYGLFYPKVCIHCQTPLIYQEEYLCLGCRTSLPKVPIQNNSQNWLIQKFAFHPHIVSAHAFMYFNKRGIAQSIIHQVKYKGNKALGSYIGELFGDVINIHPDNVDLIVPVPLHRIKYKLRGYNQSEVFASGLAKKLSVPMSTHVVSREKNTASQTKKSKPERWLNMNAIYAILDHSAIQDKHLLLVDDVLTTGATLGELATLLLDIGGAKTVSIAVIAAGK